MLAAVPVLLARDNDRLFAAPVTLQGMESPVSGQSLAFAASIGAFPKSIETSVPSSRRVIFPSLHAVILEGASGKQEVPEARPLSPPKDATTAITSTRRLVPTPRKRRAELPPLTQSERELLLERLNSVLLLPPTVHGDDHQLLKNKNQPPPRGISTDHARPPSTPTLPIPPVTPILRKCNVVRSEVSSDASKRHVFPSWELQLSDNWSLRPRNEEEVSLSREQGGGEEKEEAPMPPPLRSLPSPTTAAPLPSILRKPTTSTNDPLSSQSLQEHGHHHPRPRQPSQALPLTSPSSEGSDLPSLASSHSSDSIDEEDDPLHTKHNNTTPTSTAGGRVSFCPRVWVRLFVRSKRERERDRHTNWYSAAELDQFKADALERIQSYYDRFDSNSSHPSGAAAGANAGRGGDRVVPTGTGRVVRVSAPPTRLLFSHQALRGDDNGGATTAAPAATATTPSPASVGDAVTRDEVRRVLVVDPRGVCRDLFAAAFRLWQPTAEIRTAATSAEALALLAREPNFDVVLAEERLGSQDLLGSGSTLLAGIAGESASARKSAPQRIPLLIGATAQLDQDRERLVRHGADVVWSKPPPTMSDGLQRELLRLLLIKRGKSPPAESLPPLDKQT